MNGELDLFLDESREAVEMLEAALLDLERTREPSDIDEMFRHAHNLKGMAATIGNVPVRDLAHAMEDVLARIREGLHPSDRVTDGLLSGVDRLRHHIEAVASGAHTNPDIDLIRKLTSSVSKEKTPGRNATRSLPVDAPTAHASTEGDRVSIALDPTCALPGARAAVILRSIDDMTTLVDTEPAREQLMAGHIRRFVAVVAKGFGGRVADTVSGMLDVVEARIEKPPGDPRADRPPSDRRTVRVDLDRLDNLMDLMGELVIHHSRLDRELQRHYDPALIDISGPLGRTVADLQNAVARARMIDLEGVFRRMQRLARDTARSLGKDVVLETRGQSTEIDRSVVDDLTDPLIHLIRNSIDHGIEEPHLRQAAGKPEQGRLRLTAGTEGGQVVVSVSDDGAGIDTTALVEKAVTAGIVTRDQAESMDDAARADLVFRPGFSTKGTATAVSGRGVGLDVVRQAAHGLGGSVEVASIQGRGATFTVRLPLSLAVLDVLVVPIGDQQWAVPIHHIEETITLDPRNVHRVLDSSVVVSHATPVTLIDPYTVFGSDRRVPGRHALVVRHHRETYGIVVDGLGDRYEVVVKPAPPELSAVNHVSATTVLGNGSVAMILDVAGLIDTALHLAPT